MKCFAYAVFCLAPLSAAAAPLAKPRKVDVLKVLKAADKDLKAVTDVLADLGGGRFPVLYFTRGKNCIEREIDGTTDKNCSATTSPNVAIVTRAEGGALTVEAAVALPLEAPAWDEPDDPLGWGITFVKDYDGDGKPELCILWGYNGPMEWAVGNVHYRELAIINLDNLSLAFHEVLDRKPQASVVETIETRWKVVPKPGGGPDIALDRTISSSDEDGKEHTKKEKIVYKYDPKADKWTK